MFLRKSFKTRSIYMRTNRPWQIFVLAVSYSIGIIYTINLIYYQVIYRKAFLNICAVGIPILIFIVLLIALFIRSPWSYKLSIAFLVPIGIYSAINMLLIFYMAKIWIIIIPTFCILTVYAIFCSNTRIYFGVKKEKTNV